MDGEWWMNIVDGQWIGEMDGENQELLVEVSQLKEVRVSDTGWMI